MALGIIDSIDYKHVRGQWPRVTIGSDDIDYVKSWVQKYWGPRAQRNLQGPRLTICAMDTWDLMNEFRQYDLPEAPVVTTAVLFKDGYNPKAAYLLHQLWDTHHCVDYGEYAESLDWAYDLKQ
jgi:hypothetical protein